MKIELKNVGLSFDADPPLLEGIDLTIEPGDFVIIRGPSGSGKSSLLRLLSRLMDATTGSIEIDDHPVDSIDVTSLRRRIGYVQQTPVMKLGTVRDNLRFPFLLKAAGSGPPPDDGDLFERLKEFLLSGVSLDDDTENLSVGQRQRIALLRSLSTNPEVLLCDEPTSALDPESRDVVESRLEQLNGRDGKTVVVVTHFEYEPEDTSVREFNLTDRKLVEASP